MKIKIQMLLFCTTCLLTSCLYGPRNVDIEDRYKMQKNMVIGENLNNTSLQNSSPNRTLAQPVNRQNMPYNQSNANSKYPLNNTSKPTQNTPIVNPRDKKPNYLNKTDHRGFYVKVGDMAPNFSFITTNGKRAKLSDYKGSPVMLQFTASWCAVCIKEMPFIEREIWQAYKNRGLKVIAIDKDEPLQKAKQLIAKTKITYPMALDPKAEIFGKYADKKSGVTRNVIIDKNGRIVYLTRLFERDEFNDMKAKIRSLL